MIKDKIKENFINYLPLKVSDFVTVKNCNKHDGKYGINIEIKNQRDFNIHFESVFRVYQFEQIIQLIRQGTIKPLMLQK